MTKSFLFLLFLMLGVLMAQAVYAASPETKDQLAPKWTQREVPESPRPFLSCVLFEDNSACNVVCSLLGSIYSNPKIASGTCQKNNQCECDVLPKTNQIQKLIPKTKNGKLNATAIQNYVAKNLRTYRKTLEQGITYYEDMLDRVFIMPDTNERNCILCEIRRSQNKLLIDRLDKFVKQWSIREYPNRCSDQGGFEKALDTALINQVIKLLFRKTKPTLPSTTTENPAGNLKGFSNSQVARHKKGKKCWRNAYYHVCVNKTQTFTVLEWANENPRTWVTMDIYTDGRIYQSWIHNHNRVTIDRKADGESEQFWSFGKSAFKITKHPDGETIRKEWIGEEDQEALKMYKQFIDSWCQQNGDLVGRDNCIIY